MENPNSIKEQLISFENHDFGEWDDHEAHVYFLPEEFEEYKDVHPKKGCGDSLYRGYQAEKICYDKFQKYFKDNSISIFGIFDFKLNFVRRNSGPTDYILKLMPHLREKMENIQELQTDGILLSPEFGVFVLEVKAKEGQQEDTKKIDGALQLAQTQTKRDSNLITQLLDEMDLNFSPDIHKIIILPNVEGNENFSQDDEGSYVLNRAALDNLDGFFQSFEREGDFIGGVRIRSRSSLWPHF